MKTIDINPVNAVKAYKSATPEGKKLLIDLLGEDNLKVDIKDRIKTYEDACEELGIKPIKIDNDLIPQCQNAKDRAANYAYHQLTIIARALNEGWEPDWSNSGENKYYPYFLYNAGAGSGFAYFDCGYVHSYSVVGSRLVFKSSALAIYAGKQFTDIYNQFLQ